jgi:hypothetical protein
MVELRSHIERNSTIGEAVDAVVGALPYLP